MVTIDIWLFGKPEWEMDFEKASPKQIKELGEGLMTRLGRISEIVEKLEKNGWSRGTGLYNIYMHKSIKKEQAIEELEKLGIEEKDVIIEDYGDVDDEEGFIAIDEPIADSAEVE